MWVAAEVGWGTRCTPGLAMTGRTRRTVIDKQGRVAAV
ncbi:MAG: hypothetical protein QOF86_4636, partial [Baekduia sp.]|nr:hypothetical protein [Baekduia sp.]